MQKTEIRLLLENQGFELVESERRFHELYPKPLWGCYRPQPWDIPEEYPVLMKEVAIINNPNGADFAILSYVYL